MSIYGVRENVERARKHIEENSAHSLRYACLELRFAIEKIVYKRITSFGEGIPPQLIKTWQPPKAMKLLLALEPHADQSIKLELGTEKNYPGAPAGIRDFGFTHMLSAKWLNKYYHKLGKFLHQTSLAEMEAPPKIKSSDLAEIAEEINRVGNSPYIVSICRICDFECDFCKCKIYVSNEQIDSGAEVACFNEKCLASYKLTPRGADHFEHSRLHPYLEYSCRCGEKVALDKFVRDQVFNCWACGDELFVAVESIRVHRKA